MSLITSAVGLQPFPRDPRKAGLSRGSHLVRQGGCLEARHLDLDRKTAGSTSAPRRKDVSSNQIIFVGVMVFARNLRNDC
jgi:hypothetical protein